MDCSYSRLGAACTHAGGSVPALPFLALCSCNKHNAVEARYSTGGCRTGVDIAVQCSVGVSVYVEDG
jgi:hypothetical protein